MDKGRTRTNEPDDKKVNDNVQGLTFKNWHRQYVSRKEKGREFSSIEDSVDASIWWLKDYIKKSKERLITVAHNSTDNTKKNRTINWKEKWEEKQLYGYFKWQIGKISLEKTLRWLRKGNLKRGTESLLIAAQHYTIRTNYIKANVANYYKGSIRLDTTGCEK